MSGLRHKANRRVRTQLLERQANSGCYIISDKNRATVLELELLVHIQAMWQDAVEGNEPCTSGHELKIKENLLRALHLKASQTSALKN